MSSFDVIVLGAGTWGSAASWQLATRGYRVLAIDAFRPPHKVGSHGGATRLARQSNSSGPAYIKLTEAAWEMWGEVSKKVGQDILVKTGSAFIGEPGSEWFDKTLSNLQKSEFEYEVLSNAESSSRFPWLKTRERELTVWEPNGSIILVEPAIHSLQKLASEHGVEFRFDEPVLTWNADASGVGVRTAQGTYRADKLVVTAGARSNRILNLDLPVDVERQVLVNFKVPAGHVALPALFFAAPRVTPGCRLTDVPNLTAPTSSASPLEWTSSIPIRSVKISRQTMSSACARCSVSACRSSMQNRWVARCACGAKARTVIGCSGHIRTIGMSLSARGVPAADFVTRQWSAKHWPISSMARNVRTSTPSRQHGSI